MSKRSWLSSRSPALPAPTSSAASRIPATRQASTARRRRPMSSTASRSVSSRTMWRGSRPWRTIIRSRAWTLKSSVSSVRGERLTVSEPGRRRRAAVSMTVFRQAMSSSAVRPVASAASNIEPGVGEPAVGQRPDEPFEPARHAGRQVVDRLEDRADRPGRRDPGDERRQLGRPGRDRDVVALRVVDRHAGPAVVLAPEEGGVGLAVERVAVARLPGDLADPGRERDGRRVADRRPRRRGRRPAGGGPSRGRARRRCPA